MDIALELRIEDEMAAWDLPTTLPELTAKQFRLVVYLALRRTDESDGRVDLVEIVERVPLWIGQKPRTAGVEVQRLLDSRGGNALVHAESPTRGPYRLRRVDVVFIPSRAVANEFLATPLMTRKLTKATQAKRRFFPGELHAYDLLVQRGVFMTPVTDLILQRCGHPESIDDASERLLALKILATYWKLQLRLDEARRRAEEGLRLAKRLKRNDEIAYFLDQLGGIAHKALDAAEAERRFREEITFLESWSSERATFHLAGAWRGLAGVLRVAGRAEDAEDALRRSNNCATAERNAEALQLANIGAGAVGDLENLPTEHVTARLMALNAEAEARLALGDIVNGERLLRIAFSEATRLSHPGEAEKATVAARRFGFTL